MLQRCLCALLLLTLGGCAASPTAAPNPLHADDSGLIIGTLSSAGTDTDGQLWLERVQHRDQARQRYQLEARMQGEEPAVFAGILPAGVYQVQELRTAGARWLPANLHMPFEVRAGAVTDIGHYSLNAEPARLRTHWQR